MYLKSRNNRNRNGEISLIYSNASSAIEIRHINRILSLTLSWIQSIYDMFINKRIHHAKKNANFFGCLMKKKTLATRNEKKKKTNPCWLWRGISQVRKEGFEIFSSGFDIRISEKILNKILVFRSPFTLGFFSHFIFLFIFLFVAICVIWMPSPSCTMFMNHWHWTPYTYASFLFLLFLNLFRTYYFERRKSL